jgi:excisionase family DNA binding protein
MSQLLSVPEVARRTNSTASFWRKKIWLREIEVVRVGRLVRISESTLARWLASRTYPVKHRAARG